jgi:hypothetical protein
MLPALIRSVEAGSQQSRHHWRTEGRPRLAASAGRRRVPSPLHSCDRASRSSLGTTRVSPSRTAARAWSRPGRARLVPVSRGPGRCVSPRRRARGAGRVGR